MRRILVAIIVALAISPALAQQDPNDPGLPDSLILGSAEVDSGSSYQYLLIPLIAVTDDSVRLFYLTMHWDAPSGGVYLGSPVYNYPLTCYEIFDTVRTSESCIMTFLFPPLDTLLICPLYTGYARDTILVYRSIIAPNAPTQVVTLDSCETIGFSMDSVGFVPRFQPGYIIIGPEVGIEDENPIPASFSLSQNYPNPFNAQTTISYTLPARGPVTLSIYNLLGQRVVTLYEGVQDAGEHKVVWDAKGAPSGVYFARLVSGARSTANSMVLMK